MNQFINPLEVLGLNSNDELSVEKIKKAKKRFADKYSSEERRPRRDSEDRNSRPSFAKRGENKSFKKVNKSKKRTSVKKNSSANKSSINLNDSYNGS